MGTRRPDAQGPRPAPRIYLIVPRVESPAALADDVAAALDAADVAAVLLFGEDEDERDLTGRFEMLAPVVQARGIALLTHGSPDTALRSGADGVHVTSADVLKSALDLLKPERIVGVGALETRHDAMVAGEAGVDYVMFGEPDPAGRRPAFPAIIERVAWWAELFEVPCIGYAASLDEVGPVADAGADFVAVGDVVWSAGRSSAAAVRAVSERLAIAEPTR